MVSKGFKRFHMYASQPKKQVGGGGSLILFFEIGDSEGSGRPCNMIDTHSLKLPHTGFAPAFNAKAAAFFFGIRKLRL